MEKENKFVRKLVIWTFIISGIILLTLFFGYWATGHLFHNDIDNNYLSSFGDFIGGLVGTVIGLVTIYLVYITYISQKEELKAQQDELKLTRATQEKQNFESTFFSLLGTLGNVRNQLVLHNHKHTFKAFSSSEYQYTEEFRGTLFFDNQKLELKDNNFFVGYKNSNGSPPNITDQINDFFEENPEFKEKHFKNTEYNKLDINQIERIKLLASYYKLLKKHSKFLEHYFQSLKVIIIFIEEQISNEEKKLNKKLYLNILQSQLSNSELFHIYHYCLLSENFKKLITRNNLLSRFYQKDLISEKVHQKYYFKDIKLSEKPFDF